MAQHLIHIGWAKAGSSFLQEWFTRHPELQYVTHGIAGFRDVLEVARVVDSPFKYYVTSAEQLGVPYGDAGRFRVELALGGATPLDPVQRRQAAVCDVLKTLFPGSRVLIVTRGHRALLLSGYSQEVRGGAVLGAKARYNAMRKATPGPLPREYRHRDYDFVIGLYREAFGHDNVIVLPYELLRDDPAKFVVVLEERLGLEHREIEVGRVNPSLTAEELHWYPEISRRVSFVASLFGERAFRRIYRRYVAHVTTRNRLAPLIRVLARMAPSRRVTADDFPASAWLSSHGCAESLRGDPLFAPYAREYLWDEEYVRSEWARHRARMEASSVRA
ncbi:MAG TPA: hypothetical protein VK420_11895 [Longimicrobium sp.]|nr:hypothetical protein [Longimicrobium sp.]